MGTSSNTKLNWIVGIMALLMIHILALNIFLYISLVDNPKQQMVYSPTVNKSPENIKAPGSAKSDLELTNAHDFDTKFEEQLFEINRKVAENQQHLAMLVEALPPRASPEQIEAATARKEKRKQRRREALMLDVEDPQQRAIARHQRWLEENQDELVQLDQEMQALEALGDEDNPQQ